LDGGGRLINDWRKRMSKSIGVYRYVSNQELISEANDESNRAVKLYNDYVSAKNKQFKGKRWAVDKAVINLEESKGAIETSIGTYKSIDVEDKKAVKIMNTSIKQAEKLLSYINNEFTFLEKMKLR
jgi:hypothetical protein